MPNFDGRCAPFELAPNDDEDDYKPFQDGHSCPRGSMEPSNSSGSSGSGKVSGPFAYQTRLLERTSSTRGGAGTLARSNSQSTGLLSPNGTGTPTGTRRWAPSHRIGASLDAVRSKWEDRARENAIEEQSTSSSTASSTKEWTRPRPRSLYGSAPDAHSLPRATTEQPSSPARPPSPDRYAAPSFARSRTVPEPIIASPLSPNSTGLTVEADSPIDFATSSRIHLPSSSYDPPYRSHSHSVSAADLPSSLARTTPRRTNTIDSVKAKYEDAINAASQGTASPSRETFLPQQPQHTGSILSRRPTSMYGASSSGQTSFDRQLSQVTSPTISRRPVSQYGAPSTIGRSAPSPTTGRFFDRPRDEAPSLSRDRTLSQTRDDVGPLSRDRSQSRTRDELPTRNRGDSVGRLRDDYASSAPPTVVEPAAPSPTSLSSPPSSAMNPPVYRSSHMMKKYGSQLSAGGRRLGRHLPRIASGDQEDEPGPDRPADEPPPPVPRLPPSVQQQQPPPQWRQPQPQSAQPPPQSQPPQEPPKPRRAYQERREQRLRGIRDPDRPSNAEDVAGVSGRLKLSKDNPINNFASPLPSKALAGGARWGLWADVQRHLLQAYEYLCHVGEAQQWMEGCLGQELGWGVVEMDERLRDGVVLAKLVRVFQGEHAVRKIYEAPKLDFRHSDNINAFFNFVREVGLPEGFIFELTDLYNKKNIPKVIYCIHALSHLLARRGLAERIGNLLGQLQFSDEQLQQTHKGLKDSGVPMPNFGNLGRDLAKEFNEEPEEEPETEEERRDRLLLECEADIVKLQAQARAALARRAVHDTERRMALAQRYVAKTQAICRGYLARREAAQQRQSRATLQPWARALQAVVRGRITRERVGQRVQRIYSGEAYAVKIQAQIRGVLQRRRLAKLRAALRNHFKVVTKIQAVARANRVRQHHDSLAITFEDPIVEASIASVQALGRGVLARRKAVRRQSMLRRFEPNFVGLQAQCRGVLMRRRVRKQMAKLEDVSQTVVRIQAAVRTYLARKRLLILIRGLRRATPVIVGLQAKARAKLARQQHQDMTRYLGEAKTIKSVGGLQAFARAALARKRHTELHRTLEFVAPDVVGLQAQIRGAMVRLEYYAWRDHLWHNETVATILQAMLRGAMQRRAFSRKMAYYRENLAKVIKIQSLVRAKETREQYRQLTMGTNVTVGTIKNFVHLLDDSEADFQEELKVERLRKQVVEAIRENQALEYDVGELDTRIGLLVENAKTFEDAMKTRRGRGDSAASHAARTSLLAAHGDPFAGPSTLTHEARKKLELYQQLFYLLQTHGEYLSRLFIRVSMSDSEDHKRFIERAVLNMFGYGHDRREDYLLLKLFSVAIREHIMEASSLEDIIHDHPMYLSVAVQYVRPKHAVYIRDTFQGVVRDVVESDDLDLEVDPSKIHRQRITLEEEKTGIASSQQKDLPFHAALADPKTRAEYIRHLQQLNWKTGAFVKAMLDSTNKMPYSMRYLIRETLAAVRERFPDATDQECVSCIARVIFYRFINPAIMAPETFNLVEDTLDLTSRRNLGQISAVIQQIASGVEFNEESASYVAINGYVSTAIQPLSAWFFELANVPDPEVQYHAHEFLDATVQPKPIYISPNEIYKIHKLLSDHRTHLINPPAEKDRLAIILEELNGVPYSSNAALDEARDIVITLELSNRWATVDDTKAMEKAEWVKAKRAVLAVLRVQPAQDLITSLMKPVTEADEEMWEDILEAEELNERQTAAHPRQASQAAQEYKLQDIRRLDFKSVKAMAIQSLIELEKQDKITRSNGFQEILNDIAYDVRSKHRRRLQRQQEMQNMQEALTQLAERKVHFQKQIDAYNDYMKDALSTMQRGKKQRVVLPFTKQYKHKQNLQRMGRTPKFGSYLYTAKELYDRQIILSIDQYSPRQYDKINIIMSSNDFGVFTLDLESSLFGVTSRIASQNLSMSELLDAKYENRSAIPLFGGKVKANTERLLFQINKKFYV